MRRVLSYSMSDAMWLIVEDRQADLRELVWTAQDLGYEDFEDIIHHEPSFTAAFDTAVAEHPEIVITDINLNDADGDGIELIRRLKQVNGFKIIVVSTSRNADDVSAVREAGALMYVEKLEGTAFAEAMEVVLAVAAGHYVPKQWVSRTVFVDDSLVDPDD